LEHWSIGALEHFSNAPFLQRRNATRSNIFISTLNSEEPGKLEEKPFEGGTFVSFVIEPEKKVPVVYDVDVAVAGGGIAGAMDC